MLYNKAMPIRERSFRVEAVIIRHSDFGEADRLVWLFTREYGKVRALAKGVRKVISRKAGHLEPFTRVRLQLAKGRDLFIITQAETYSAYGTFREELNRFGYASYVVELIDRFTTDEESNPKLFQLLVDTLSYLNSEVVYWTAVRYFELHLLDLVGYRPHLINCLACQKPIEPENQFFSALHGGVLCPMCGRDEKEARPVSLSTLRALRHFQRSTYMEAKRLVLTREVNQECEALLQYYLTFLLERSLNSLAFLRQISENGVN